MGIDNIFPCRYRIRPRDANQVPPKTGRYSVKGAWCTDEFLLVDRVFLWHCCRSDLAVAVVRRHVLF